MKKSTVHSPSRKPKAVSVRGRASGVPYETYQYLFEHHPAPLWVYDLKTLHFLLVNEAAIAAYGYSQEEFLSMTLLDIRPVEEQASLERYIETPRLAFSGAGIWHHIKKDGSRMTVEIVSHALDWNGRAARLVMARDITEQAETLSLLRDSESGISALLENALDSIISIDANGRITEFNPAAEATFKWRRESVIGQPIAELIIPPEQRSAHRAGLNRFLETGKSRILRKRIEAEALRMDGTRIPVELTIYPVKWKEAIGFTSFLRDISERKRAEAELTRLNQDLEQKVLDRTHQLEAVNHELEAFSYSVSHDLRSPLRAIDGFSQALVEDYGNVLNPEATNYLDRIQAATRRMGALIDDLIELARVSRSEIRREPVDLGELAAGILKDLREQEPGRDVHLEIMQPLWVSGDRKLIGVALTNLLQNAWKFTRKREGARIRLGQIEQDGERPYFVEDNGAGFDMTYADKLFTPFQRLHDSREFEGTGIGLATVHRIMIRHGGRVWVRADPGKGATFYFTLPGDTTHA